MNELERKYRALVKRISGYPMGEAARARILAEVAATYRRDRAAAAVHRRANSPRQIPYDFRTPGQRLS